MPRSGSQPPGSQVGAVRAQLTERHAVQPPPRPGHPTPLAPQHVWTSVSAHAAREGEGLEEKKRAQRTLEPASPRGLRQSVPLLSSTPPGPTYAPLSFLPPPLAARRVRSLLRPSLMLALLLSFPLSSAPGRRARRVHSAQSAQVLPSPRSPPGLNPSPASQGLRARQALQLQSHSHPLGPPSPPLL